MSAKVFFSWLILKKVPLSSSVSIFSGYGKKSVDVAAPGSDIYSTIPNGDAMFFFKTCLFARNWYVWNTPTKLNIAPEKLPSPKEKICSSNHPFSGAMLNFGGCLA